MKQTRMWVLFAVMGLLAQGAGADVLWDQSDFDMFGAGYFNSVSGDPPLGVTMYGVNDVTVGGEGWHVESISTYYSALDPGWGSAITEGKLHVFPKSGPLPVDSTDDPAASMTVPMTGTFDTDHIVVTASGLDLDLPAGDYWIGITPVAPSGPFGPEIQMSSFTLMGDATASDDPSGSFGGPGWFVFNPDLDATILIEGVVNTPTPAQEMAWGQLKNLYR